MKKLLLPLLALILIGAGCTTTKHTHEPENVCRTTDAKLRKEAFNDCMEKGVTLAPKSTLKFLIEKCDETAYNISTTIKPISECN